MVSLNRVPDIVWLHKMPGSVAKAVLVRWDSSSFAGGEADLKVKKKLGDSFCSEQRWNLGKMGQQFFTSLWWDGCRTASGSAVTLLHLLLDKMLLLMFVL